MIDTREQQKLFEDLVKRVTYRPGYEINVVPWEEGDPVVTVRMTRVDDDPDDILPKVQFGFVQAAPRWLETPEDALRFIKRMVIDFELDLAGRWLRLDGQLVKEIS